jgi:hypothetical protein
MEERAFKNIDLLKAPRLAWSIRKMQAGMRGLLAAWGAYLVFSYAALAASPLRAGGVIELFRRFEFFPFLPRESGGVLALGLWYFGIGLALCIIIDTAVAVSAIAVEDFRGNILFQTAEAIRFAKSRRSVALVSMAALALLPLPFLGGFAAAGLVVRIPVIGPFALALFSIPLFVWGLAAVAVILVFIFGFFIVPAITAWSGDDILETVLQAFSLVWSRPVKFILLQIAARLIAAFAAVLLGFLSLASVLLALMAIASFAGNTMNEIFTVALYRFPGLMDSERALSAVIGLSISLGTPFIADTTAVSASVRIAGWIMGSSMLLVCLWIASYGFSTFFVSQAVIYRVLRPARGGDEFLRPSIGGPAARSTGEKVEPACGGGVASM